MKNKKVLYITTIGTTMNFFKSFIKELKDNKIDIDIAANTDIKPVNSFYEDLGCCVYNLDFTRSPLNVFSNIKAVKQIKDLVKKENYDIVHCHTPIAAACTRIACKGLRKNGLKVVYTAHGFHFFKGSPKINWLMYYPIEWVCSFFTDVLVTINKEDYNRAKKHFHAKKIVYVPGVGINVSKFRDCKPEKDIVRKKLNIPMDAYIVLSVGELNQNKNHKSVIKAISLCENKDNIYYIIAGQGPLEQELIDYSKEIGFKNLNLLGYCTNINELLKCSDLYVHPSFREGLPVSVMEAMSSGIPVVVSDIRGNADLVKSEFRFNPGDVEYLSKLITKSLNNNNFKCHKSNNETIDKFSTEHINNIMLDVYKTALKIHRNSIDLSNLISDFDIESISKN